MEIEREGENIVDTKQDIEECCTDGKHEEVEEVNDESNMGTPKVSTEQFDSTNGDPCQNIDKPIQPINMSYANVVENKDELLDKNLCFIPTAASDDGTDVVIFEEELVPLIMQKWSPEIDFEKTEPDKIPLWVKMYNIPLEAWTSKGISTLASGLGKPLIMDDMTAKMCQFGKGRIGYARVLVEVDAGKKFKDFIKIEYRDANGNVIRTRPKSADEKRKEQELLKEQRNSITDIAQKACLEPTAEQLQEGKSGEYGECANKFAVLDGYDDENGKGLNSEQKNEVNFFTNQKLQPTLFETSKWSHLMVDYFKDRLEEVTNYGKEDDDIEEVLEDISDIETVQQNSKKIYSFIYAANYGKKRSELWKDVCLQKNITSGHPWALLGDFNVTLSPNEHYVGGSNISQDMQEFTDCVNLVEIDDLCSSGLLFTWSKSPLNPNAGTLKKLDRVMVNEKFGDVFPKAHAIFLP
uniref:Uncharacterized protein n=1 Tax=Tanacetum cinerariifolium TaxID=118510 RepID=A0A699HXJ7_TANCI|nr:hypothetical protein [Tanacetum cinerariifolium]GEY82923.1 hypothetical protein [Tanacetum cinerariifolium]